MERTLKGFPSAGDYRRFVLDGLGSDAPNPFAEATAGIAYGGDSFVRKVLKLVDQRPPEPETPSLAALRRLEPRPSAERVPSVVCEVFVGLSPCRRRRVLVYALSRNTLLTGKQIAVLTGLKPSAVTMAHQGVARRLADDQGLVRGLVLLRERLESPAAQAQPATGDFEFCEDTTPARQREAPEARSACACAPASPRATQ